MKDRPSSSLHRRFAVETPEHVRLDYVLADVGSRAAALAIDLVVLIITLIVVGWVMNRLGLAGAALANFSRPVFFFIVFFLIWGYFILFEALWGGRTPGKRALGMRVVHAGGEPLSWQGSVLRNLIKIVVDMQPLPSGMLGAVSIVATRRAQRLGDLAAGTVVVRDAGGS